MHVEHRARARIGLGLWPLVVGITAFISGLGGCPGNGQPDGNDGNNPSVTEVAMQNLAFVPKEVTILQGESVRWTNREPIAVPHTTTSGDPDDGNQGLLWDSGNLLPGQSFTHTFNDVGEFEYFCIPHQNMAAMRHAKVIVTAP